MIYLDNAATTKISANVLNAMLPYMKEEYGNAGTIYALGRQAADAVERAREQVAGFVGARPEQIVFTSGGSEANSLAILGCRDYLSRCGKKHIITTKIEHDSVLNAINALSGSSCVEEGCIKHGFYTSFLPVNMQGIVSSDDLKQKIDNYNDVGLASFMYVNNELGSVNPIIRIGEVCRERNILFFTDCVQAAGEIRLDVNNLGCHFMSISSHKIHGPKGAGALFVQSREYLSPIIHGGFAQEFGLRGGTENVAAIVGFGVACEEVGKKIQERNSCILHCKKHFYEVLKKCLADEDESQSDGLMVNGTPPDHNGKILSLTFCGVDAESLVLLMDVNGVCISAGSACAAHESKPSHVLAGIGKSDDYARSTVRISFSGIESTEEVEEAAKTLAHCVKVIRGVAQ